MWPNYLVVLIKTFPTLYCTFQSKVIWPQFEVFIHYFGLNLNFKAPNTWAHFLYWSFKKFPIVDKGFNLEKVWYLCVFAPMIWNTCGIPTPKVRIHLGMLRQATPCILSYLWEGVWFLRHFFSLLLFSCLGFHHKPKSKVVTFNSIYPNDETYYPS